MENYLSIAEQFVHDKYGKDYGIVNGSIVEKEDFYSFCFNTVKFIESEDWSLGVVGQGPVFISKSDGRIFQYGSAFNYERALTDLRRRLVKEKAVKEMFPAFDCEGVYNLVIYVVHKEQLLMDALITMKIECVVPEVVGENIYRISRPYKKEMLRQRLSDLPVTFHNKSSDWIGDFFEVNKKQGLCEMTLEPYIHKPGAKYISKATKEDLEPLW